MRDDAFEIRRQVPQILSLVRYSSENSNTAPKAAEG
jgi:hypothetical protein